MSARPVFYVCLAGDPYSRAAWCYEEVSTGLIYRGDLSGMHSRARLERELRRHYPNCIVRRREP